MDYTAGENDIRDTVLDFIKFCDFIIHGLTFTPKHRLSE